MLKQTPQLTFGMQEDNQMRQKKIPIVGTGHDQRADRFYVHYERVSNTL